jgi:colanic acid biosynthesis glycosyl transferase WcaI
MRILINGINFSPELTGIGKYSGEMAEWLAARGHEVRVVTSPPYYPEWRVAKGYQAWRYKREFASGKGNDKGGKLVVWRCPLWVPAHPSGLKRLIHLASFALSSLPVMLCQILWKPDVVMVIEPPLVCAPLTWLVAKLCGAKTWLHVQDFEVNAAFDLGILPSGRMRSVILRIESKLMQAFGRVSTISNNMLKTLHAKGVVKEKSILFPNWVDLNAIFPLEKISSFRAELGIAPTDIVALYSGNMGEKQGLEVVLDAARELERQTHIKFVLCGDGAARYRLIQAYGSLPNVMWLPLQPIERLNDLLNLAEVHLLPQRADIADLVMPSKLTGMLASGKPILGTAHPGTEVANIVQMCGVVTNPGDANALARALLQLANDGVMRALLGQRARTYALEHFERDTVLGKFELGLIDLLAMK